MKVFIQLSMLSTGNTYLVDPLLIADVIVTEQNQTAISLTGSDDCVKVKETPAEILDKIKEALRQEAEVTNNTI